MDKAHEGLGVIGPNPKAFLDYKLPGLSAVSTAVASLEDDLDWQTGLNLDDLPAENQNGSGSCTEQAFCYDFAHKFGIQLSRQDGYSRIGRPDQAGAYPHEPYWLHTDSYGQTSGLEIGQYTRAVSPDPVKQTEAAMKTRVELPGIPRMQDYRVRYWSPTDTHIDTIARMIREYDGITGCFILTGEGWEDRTYPRAPRREDTDWMGAHMLWLCGYKLVGGQKKIIAKSSWKSTKYHYLGEDYYYIGSEWIFGHYAAEYRKVLNDMEFVVVEYKGKLGVGVFDGGFVESVFWAKDKQQILDLCKAYNVQVVGYSPDGYPLATHRIEKFR